jgi:hypothetical protein
MKATEKIEEILENLDNVKISIEHKNVVITDNEIANHAKLLITVFIILK